MYSIMSDKNLFYFPSKKNLFYFVVAFKRNIILYHLL